MNKRVIPAYIYPSFIAVTLIPLSQFPFPEARFLWNIFSLICFLLCIFFTFYIFKLRPKFDITTLLIFSIFLVSMPTLESFTLGQVNYPVLLLILISFVLHKHKVSYIGGAALAIASLIKISPAFLLLYFLWRRDFRLAAGFLITLTAITILMLVFAPSVDIAFIRDVFPAISARTPELNNKALAVWWQFLFTTNNLADPILHLPLLSSILSMLSALVIITTLFFVFKRSELFPKTDDSTRGVLQFLVCCVAMLLIQPYLEIHHLIFAFPAVVGIIVLTTRDAFNWKYTLLLLGFFLLLNSRGENSFRWLGPHWYSAFLSTPQTYGLLIIFIFLCLYLAGRTSLNENYEAKTSHKKLV